MSVPEVCFKGVFSAFFLIVFSCTIIEDSDITSLSELNTLKWKGFEIKQETNSGNSSQFAQVLYDSAKNTVDPSTGVTIVRKMKFSLPALGSRKMKLRSNSTANTNFFISYKSGNQPFNFWIQQGDSVIELYRFRYNTSNVLSKIVTIINPIDGLKPKVWTNDTLIYSSNVLTSLIRRSPFSTATSTITLEHQSQILNKISYGSTIYQHMQNCSQSSNSCGAYQVTPVNNTFVQVDYQFSSVNTLLNQIALTDHRVDNNGGTPGGCPNCREPDTYYLHPMMIFKNQFTLGTDLLMIYMIDWWVVGATITSPGNQSFNKNDVVSLNFSYAP